ncbi:MAG: tripartite tricarboxylate transporter TctB family protein [Burkholderiales bacterium]|nr:tripartite tricarboxylate transporter TctB family protein [Burkholderiales bacterium]
MISIHRTPLRRLAPYVLVGCAGLYLLYVATQFEFHRRAGTLGPDFWPKLILALLLIVCTCEILRIIFAKNPDSEIGSVLEDITRGADVDSGAESAEPPSSHPWRLLAGMAATLAYVALVGSTGFVLTTAAYLAAFLLIGGYRKTKVIVMMSIGGPLLLMFVFMKLVYISLPLGSGPFAQFSILLMGIMGIR